MPEDIFSAVVTFFANVQHTPEGQEELKRFNRQIVFEPTDGKPVYVTIKGGKARVKKEGPEDTVAQPIRLVGTTVVFRDLLLGKRRFTDVYTAYAERDMSKMLTIRESPYAGIVLGTIGGPLVRWTGKLIRIGQEVR